MGGSNAEGARSGVETGTGIGDGAAIAAGPTRRGSAAVDVTVSSVFEDAAGPGGVVPGVRATVGSPSAPGSARPRASAAGSPRVVVAAVIERDGRILAARRTGPPKLAGRWEFPGGKVEAGESDAAALERECLEEIGVRIAVGPAIGPAYAIAGGAMVVRTYRASLLEGEPRALDSHDALAWLAPDSAAARELDWLDGDLLILDALVEERAVERAAQLSKRAE